MQGLTTVEITALKDIVRESAELTFVKLICAFQTRYPLKLILAGLDRQINPQEIWHEINFAKFCDLLVFILFSVLAVKSIM